MIEALTDRWSEIAVAFAAVMVVAFLGGIMTEVGSWYENLKFPWFRPPNWLFGPAWSVIYILIATGGVIAWDHAPDGAARQGLLWLLAINGVLNVIWSPLFFKLRRPDWAFYELIVFWLSVAALVVYVSSISSTAGLIMSPYLAWVTFAGLLNLRVVQLNKPFGTRA